MWILPYIQPVSYTHLVNDKQWWFAAVMQPLLLSFVGIYFMLSGLFLLDSATGDITQFYKKRVKVIVIPFLFFSLLYYLFYVSRSQEVLSWWEYPVAVSYTHLDVYKRQEKFSQEARWDRDLFLETLFDLLS